MQPPPRNRGQLATAAERSRVEDVIWELEMRTPIAETATSEALLGRWALVYASEDATRSSPFFWAFRYVSAHERCRRLRRLWFVDTRSVVLCSLWILWRWSVDACACVSWTASERVVSWTDSALTQRAPV